MTREHRFRSSCALTHFIPQQPRTMSSSHTRQRGEAYVLHLLGFPPGCICSPTLVHSDGEPLLPQGIRGRQVSFLNIWPFLPERKGLCRDRPWHKSIADRRTDAQRQQEISTTSYFGAFAAYHSLSCRDE